MRLYSDASPSTDSLARSAPSAATRRVWVPCASSSSLACGSAVELPSPSGAKEPRAPDAMLGSPRSVLIFTVPESCSVSDAAIFSMSCCALISGRSGSPESASAGTRPMVATATPTTVTGTAYRAARRRPARGRAARAEPAAPSTGVFSDSYGAMCALPPWSGDDLPYP